MADNIDNINVNSSTGAKLLEAAASATVETSPEKLEANKPGYLAINFTFSPSRGDIGGAFCLIFDGTTGETVLQSLWVTRPYVPTILKPNRDWRTFIRIFPQIGKYDKLLGDKLNEVLTNEVLNIEERIAIFQEGTSTVKRKLVRAEGEIRRAFERAAQSLFDVACDDELIPRADLERAKLLQPIVDPEAEARKKQEEEEAKKKEEEEKAGKEKPFEETLVQCIPRVDPINGKPMIEIVPGDIIEVGFQTAEAGTSALIQKFLETSGQEPLFPVDEVDRRDEKTYIYLRISDEIRGVLVMTKNLRLRTKRQPQKPSGVSNVFENIVFLGILGAGLIGILIAIRYILM